MALRPCLGCGEPCRGSRCARCRKRPEQTTTERGYGRQHKDITRRVIAEHVARYGWVCVGWRRDPHPVKPGRLTGDHWIPKSIRPDLALDPGNYVPMCGSCNSAKGDAIPGPDDRRDIPSDRRPRRT